MKRNGKSHRDSTSRFVRIDLRKRSTGSKAIVTCTKGQLPDRVAKYQALGYELINVTNA